VEDTTIIQRFGINTTTVNKLGLVEQARTVNPGKVCFEWVQTLSTPDNTVLPTHKEPSKSTEGGSFRLTQRWLLLINYLVVLAFALLKPWKSEE
jgi:hypothetical protein